MKIYHYHIFKNSNRGDKAIQQAIKQIVNKSVDCKIEWVDKDLNSEECTAELIQEMNDTGDALIIGGSGLYADFSWGNFEGAHWYFPCDRKLYDKFKIPIILWGLGMNLDFVGNEKPLTEDGLEAIAAINNKAALSSVRDFYTSKKLGIPDVVLDPAFYLLPGRTNLRTDAGKMNIGVNLACHTRGAEQAHGRYEWAIRNTVDAYKDIADFYYFVHHNAERKNIETLPWEFKSVIDTNPASMKAAYESMDLVVNSMMHSQVLCSSVGTPYINFGYNIKNANFTHTFHNRAKVWEMGWLDKLKTFLKGIEDAG